MQSGEKRAESSTSLDVLTLAFGRNFSLLKNLRKVRFVFPDCGPFLPLQTKQGFALSREQLLFCLTGLMKQSGERRRSKSTVLKIPPGPASVNCFFHSGL
ncbi:MAG: hypothetical protein WA374_13695 [Acidobacteriaceae bacterium]